MISTRSSSGTRIGADNPLAESSVLARAYWMLAVTQSRAGPGGGLTTNAGGNAPIRGSKSGSSQAR